MTDSVVVEGQVKFRDGKKWKTRWVALRKPSPVADCLYVLVYKERKKGKDKVISQKERLNVTLEGICGVEPGTWYDGVSYTLTILSLAHTLVLGFNSHDSLLAWDSRVCLSLGEVHRFRVNVEPGTKLESGPASLHLCNNSLVLSRGVPPVIIGHWKLSSLRRYGAVPNGFVFEGGTRCGCWAGVFFLSCSDGEHISFLFDCIVRGTSPSRAIHGLRTSLPDPKTDPESTEKRIIQEAADLERRLSILSIGSLTSSTATTYTYSTSVVGDEQLSVSSSSSSQSDASYGSRLSFWGDPSARYHSSETASNPTLQALTSSDDHLYPAVTGGSRATPSLTQLHPRGLHDSGRQSSLDSGIGIATSCQSAYSGSLSSYTESLDRGCPEEGEEFGSLTSLPASPPPPVLPPPPPSTLFSPPSQSTMTSLCASRSSSWRHTEEYQTPSLLELRYDTPRSILQALCLRGTSQEGAPGLGRSSRSSGDGGGRQGEKMANSPKGFRVQRQATMQDSWDRERGLSMSSEGGSISRPPLIPGETQITSSPSPSADTQDSFFSIRRKDVSGKSTVKKRSAPSRAPSVPPPLPHSLIPDCPKTTFGVFQSSYMASPCVSLENGLQSYKTVDYVNIPITHLQFNTHKEPLHKEQDHVSDVHGPNLLLKK